MLSTFKNVVVGSSPKAKNNTSQLESLLFDLLFCNIFYW